jgi:hypothetical protein
MLLECWGRDHRPLFLTWTFKPSEYVDSRIYVKQETQKLYKRIRRWGYDLRYFTAVERGTKKGRLHAHSIVWSRKLSQMSWTDCFWTLYNAWNKGGIKLRYVQSPGAFHYTAKYLLKDLIHDVDYITGELTSKRNYTWSNRPQLGQKGIERWKALTDRMFHVEQEDAIQAPNWFHMPFLGKLEKAYIPSDTYNKYMKNKERDRVVESIDFETVPDQAVMYDPDPPVIEWIDKNCQILV